MKKLYTILILLFNLIIRRKYYTLKFVSDTTPPPFKRWFYDFKHWGFQHDNLEMVNGADTLCELYANGKDKLTINIIATNKDLGHKENYQHFKAITPPKEFTFWDKIIFGRDYKQTLTPEESAKVIINNEKVKTFWICPVTLFVMGRYPKHIYIKENETVN